MRYVAAALLLKLAGEDASAEKIEKILGSVGVECDKTNMDLVLKNIAGKNLEELMAEGMVGHPPSHGNSADLVSSFWGSYFCHPEPRKPNSVLSRASSFAKLKQSLGR